MIRRITLLLAACTSPLPEPYVVADLRVIAIIAEPPEAVAGTRVTLTAILADPRAATAPSVRFARCADRSAFDCAEDETIAEVEATAIGPGLFSASAEVVLAGAAGAHDVTLVHAPGIDALKRVVVGAPGAVHNANPVIDRIYMVTDDGAIHDALAPGTRYIAVPAFQAEVLEPFVITQDDGTAFPALEKGIFSWSCSVACTFDTPISYDFTSVRLTPGESDVPFVVYLVMRDGRGGEAFSAFY